MTRKICAIEGFLVLSIVALYGQDYRAIDITVGGEIEFVLKNPSGKRSGIDPRSGQRYDEINDSYGEFSVDSENPNVEPPEPVNEFMSLSPAEGLYELTLYGTKLSRFSLSVTLGGAKLNSSHRFELKGVIDNGEVKEYKFDYSLAPTTPYKVERILTQRSLQLDIDNCSKLRMLGGGELSKNLIMLADRFNEDLSKKDSSKARHDLSELKKKIQEVREKTEKEEGKEENRGQVRSKRVRKDPFIDGDAFKILREDVDALLELLPLGKKNSEGEEN